MDPLAVSRRWRWVPHRRPTGHPAASRAGRPTGQSLVEFALVLPVILLLLLVSLDFGRVFLGYINVQNMARIAANFAANNPEAWGSAPNTTVQGQYARQVVADAAATNCQLPTAGGAPIVPPPQFADRTGDGVATGLGDNAKVQLTCTFGVITPIIADIVGGSLAVTAESNFPVKTGMSGVAAGGGGSITTPSAAFSGNGLLSSRATPYPELSDVSPFQVEFRDTSGGAPTSWSWDFGDGRTSTLQDPLAHVFECTEVDPCVYTVSLTSTNVGGSTTAHMTIRVLPGSQVNFTADRTRLSPGMAATFQDVSAPGGTNWRWDFGDGGTADGGNRNPSHTYASPGSYTVSLTVTYPTGDVTIVKSGYISVEAGLCTVPDLGNVRFNDAGARFAGARFTGAVQRDTGAPSGNFVITAQDLTATSLAPCTSNIKVTRP